MKKTEATKGDKGFTTCSFKWRYSEKVSVRKWGFDQEPEQAEGTLHAVISGEEKPMQTKQQVPEPWGRSVADLTEKR